MQPAQPDGKAHIFIAKDDQFLFDGKPCQIIAGEMHYQRIPRVYWRSRLRMARAMGLNAITTAVFWNGSEPSPGIYDFSDNNDVGEFIREAQQEGLYVVLRPGPFAGGDWEFGGLPAWLLKDPATVVRSTDPRYMEPARRWLNRLGKEIGPLQIGNGGPILMVQVEEAYGSLGSDQAYLQAIRQALLDAGLTKVQLYTSDGPGEVARGSMPNVPIGVSFAGDTADAAEKSYATVEAIRPNSPFFVSEFWAGWFDVWGGKHAHTSIDLETANLSWILSHGYSVSIHPFHGGTNFGWMNGAYADDAHHAYAPFVTSYDFDAALDEGGRPTAKFNAFRDLIAKVTKAKLPPVPSIPPPIAIRPFKLTEAVSLWASLPKAIEVPAPLTMEDVGQSYGYILYRTRLPIGNYDTGILTVHDYGCTYVDQQPTSADIPWSKITASRLAVGKNPCIPVDRRVGRITAQGPDGGVASVHRLESGSDVGPDESWWDALVENTGRTSYSSQLRIERKGVVGFKPPNHPPPLVKWYMYPLPMSDPRSLPFRNTLCLGPCFYRGTFNLSRPGDTFLDTSQLSKGQLWVNGHALGRFWKIGPQKTLYVPGPWLKQGANEVIIFDMDAHPFAELQGLTQPNLGP